MFSPAPGLVDGELTVRSIRLRDARELEQLLLTHREWLAPWEATNPAGGGKWDVRGSIRQLLAQAKAGTTLPYVLEHDDRLVGQLTVSGIAGGALSSASLGYWISPEVAGRGFTPTAVAMVIDWCFAERGLHRMEICIRPENAASRRVVEKLGLRYEGFRRRYIHIAGDWRDHVCFAVTREDAPEGVLARWRSGGARPQLAAIPEGDVALLRQPFDPARR